MTRRRLGPRQRWRARSRDHAADQRRVRSRQLIGGITNACRRNRSAFAITETLLKLMAALASMGQAMISTAEEQEKRAPSVEQRLRQARR